MNLELREYGLVLAGAEEGLTISSRCQAKGRFILFSSFLRFGSGFFQFRIWVPSRQSKAGSEAKTKNWERNRREYALVFGLFALAFVPLHRHFQKKQRQQTPAS